MRSVTPQALSATAALSLPDASPASALPVAPAADAAQDSPLSPAERARVEKAAVKFEAMFIGQMLQQMRRTTREFAGEDSVFKDRIASDMLDMADTAVADSLAHQRAFGIADAILRQLLPTDPSAKR
ncbi:MAG: rod-binding protein [Proteobacteria bacterium]|uniref:rod-binding protein n=1 Tax=Aquabacterium sp. TaxID=1872578 RepID=UPI0035C77B4D|nr:rod-binding protein [Pseudomonadota bacterium]